MRLALIALAALPLTACGSREDTAEAPLETSPQTADAPTSPVSSDSAGAEQEASGWDLQSSGEGVGLVLSAARGSTAIRLFCPAGATTLLVNVPAFRPIASEERLSFGSGGEAVALVADPRGDAQRGGVSGRGEAPANLASLIKGGLSASYGAQKSGPHAPPPSEMTTAFVAACKEPSATFATKAPAASNSAHACLMQGKERLRVTPYRAVGTEPFWGARIEGRCVTYSHPEDQSGTRVWARYTKGQGGEAWEGALGGKPFELRIRPARGCSDGMSDKRYPLAVDLTVNGEQRKGCAEAAGPTKA